MGKNKRIIVVAYVTCCVAMTAAGCSGNKDNNLNGLCKISKEQTEEQNAENEQNEVNSEESEDNETAPDAPGDMNYHYYCLEADDPVVQELIADSDWGFTSRVFIKGLIGYTPNSDISGMLESYYKDDEIIIKENPELFPSWILSASGERMLMIIRSILQMRLCWNR